MIVEAGINGFGRFGLHLLKYWLDRNDISKFTISYINDDFLNINQKKAVENSEGSCLVLAGAGSGKTRVLTEKIAYLVDKVGIPPEHILSVTFTNKAAREMQNRITNFLNEKTNSLPWLGTFHSVSAKLLRKHADAVGLNSRFTIIDQEDQLRLIKNICKAENIDVKKISPQFNTVVIFSTTDFSNHGHPDPLDCPENITRKSLALYYFSKGRPQEEIITKPIKNTTHFKSRQGIKNDIESDKTNFFRKIFR